MSMLWYLIDQMDRLLASIQEYYRKLPYEDALLQIIAVTILIIFIITIILAVTVIILRAKNSLKARRFQKLESHWDAILIDMIFSEDQLDNRPLKIRRSQRLAFINYLYQYTQRLQGVELERVKELAKPFLPMIVKGIKGGYPELRARHVNMLGTFGFPEYIDAIKIALYDRSPIVSMSAAWALARPEYPEHCQIILPVLNLFDHWSMNFLSSMLAGMGSGASPALREFLSDSKQSIRVRLACAEALKTMSDLQSAELSANLLVNTEDPELIAALLRLLGKVGVGTHCAVIHRFINSDISIVRMHAFSTIGQLGNPDDGELIRDGLEDKSSWVALHAARTLIQLQREDILEEAVQSDRSCASLARQVLAEARAV